MRAQVKSKYSRTLKKRRRLNLNWEQKVRESTVINYLFFIFFLQVYLVGIY